MNRFTKIFFFVLTFPVVIFCNPTGSEIVTGKATIVESDKTLTINQFTDKVIINWEDFSIGAEETTRFVHPPSSEILNQNPFKFAVLNRVVGDNVSEIYGTLKSNGNVYLVNKNGVVVGPEGVIDTNGFIASTLDLVDMEVLSFSGDSDASIINAGTIKALKGNVFLIAQKVENQGIINADNGRVGIAGSNTEVLLTEEGLTRIFVKGGVGNIENNGVIEATEVELAAVGGNMYSMAINQEGLIKATGLNSEKGRIFLNSEKGEISFSGLTKAFSREDNGGIVKVVANKIHMKEGSKIDVSNQHLGGEVFLRSTGFENSIKIDAGANIEADSTHKGCHGGKVEFIGDDISVDGFITARSQMKEGFWGCLKSLSPVNTGGGISIFCDKNLSITGDLDVESWRNWGGSIFITGKDLSLIKPEELNNTVKNPVILPKTKGSFIIVSDVHEGVIYFKFGAIEGPKNE